MQTAFPISKFLSLLLFLLVSSLELTGQNDPLNINTVFNKLNIELYKTGHPSDETIKDIAIGENLTWALGIKSIFTFDGNKLSKQFDLGVQNYNMLPGNIYLDKQGMLWIVVNHANNLVSNILYYNPKTQTLKPIKELLDLPLVDLSDDKVFVHGDEEKNIWITINNRTYKYDGKLSITPLNINSPRNIFQVEDRYFTTKGDSLLILNESWEVTKTLFTGGGLINIFKGYLNDYIAYFFDNDQLFHSHAINNDTISLSHQHNSNLTGITEIKALIHEETKLGITSVNRNLLITNLETNETINFGNNAYLTFKAYQDKGGNILIPGASGLLILNTIPFPFEKFFFEEKCSFRSIKINKNDIIELATYNGFYQIDLNTNDIIRHRTDILGLDRTSLPNGKDLMVGHDKKMFLIDHSSHHKTHISEIKYTHFGYEYTSSLRLPFYDEFRDRLWYITKNSLLSSDINLAPGKTTHFIDHTNDSLRSINHMIAFNDEILFGGKNGIYKINKQDEYSRVKALANYHQVNCMAVDSLGNLIVNLQGDGFMVLDSAYNIVEHYDYRSGVRSSINYTIELDKNNNIWSGTDAGLAFIDRKTKSVDYFNNSEIYGQVDFNYFSSYTAKNGIMYFGGTECLLRFNPEVIYQKLQSAQEKVQLIKASRRERKSDNFIPIIDNDYAIDDNYPELKFEFGSPQINSFDHIMLEYHIGDKWKLLNSPEISINELDYGSHNLKVRNKLNGNLILDTQIQSVKPYYFKIWFLTLVFFVALFLIYFITYLRSKSLQSQNKKLEEQVTQRTKELELNNEALSNSLATKDKILSVLAHDLKSPLSSLVNLTDTVNFLASNNRTDDLLKLTESVQTRANDLKQLVDNLMHWSLQQQDKIYLVENEFKVEGPIKETIKQFNYLSNQKQLNITLNTDQSHLVKTDHEAFKIVLRNLLHNAIKFSEPNGIISISSYRSNGSLKVSVSDNGQGILPENISKINNNINFSTIGTLNEAGTGLGLNLSTYFANKMGGSLKIENNESKGVTATLSLKAVERKLIPQ